MRKPTHAVMLAVALALGAAATALPRIAAATPSYDNCTGMLAFDGVASTHVGTPGVWCLDADVAIATDFGVAGLVEVDADDVTIDCKGHRLRWTGLPDVQNAGVISAGRQRVAIRNCRVEGFLYGILVVSEGTGLVEDNQVSGSQDGIVFNGAAGTIRRNRVSGASGDAIYTDGRVDIIDNVLDGLAKRDAYAIVSWDPDGSEISGNLIRTHRPDEADPFGTFNAVMVGLLDGSGRATLRDNVIVGYGEDTGRGEVGIACFDDAAWLVENTIMGFKLALSDCPHGGTDDLSP